MIARLSATSTAIAVEFQLQCYVAGFSFESWIRYSNHIQITRIAPLWPIELHTVARRRALRHKA
jgi:hypothetical protein